jgi:hypothetical protein
VTLAEAENGKQRVWGMRYGLATPWKHCRNELRKLSTIVLSVSPDIDGTLSNGVI